MTTVLITGATGFVGSHALEALAEVSELDVIAVCRDRSKLLPGFNGEVRQGDLRDAGFRKAVVEGVDILCNAMAWSSLWGNEENSRRLFLEPNLALIEAARGAGVKRFINTSTTSAAAPDRSSDPDSRGIPRPLWPHLCNVIRIEDALREAAGPDFQVVNLRLGIFAGRRYLEFALRPIAHKVIDLERTLTSRITPWNPP